MAGGGRRRRLTVPLRLPESLTAYRIGDSEGRWPNPRSTICAKQGAATARPDTCDPDPAAETLPPGVFGGCSVGVRPGWLPTLGWGTGATLGIAAGLARGDPLRTPEDPRSGGFHGRGRRPPPSAASYRIMGPRRAPGEQTAPNTRDWWSRTCAISGTNPPAPPRPHAVRSHLMKGRQLIQADATWSRASGV